MEKKYGLLGGDNRIVELAKILSEEQKVYIYGLENALELKKTKNIETSNTLKEFLDNVQIIISSIPFTKDGKTVYCNYTDKTILIKELEESIKDKTFIAGNISNNILREKNNKIIDIAKNEEFAVLNAIATAEGVIQLAISNTKINLQDSNIAILGYGRIGKILAGKLKNLCKNISCFSADNPELVWIKAYGNEGFKLSNLKEKVNVYDIVINTIPKLVLDKQELEKLDKECLIIDIASSPGGINKKEADNRNIKYLHALGLPGKTSPKSSAEIIKNIIEKYSKGR